MTSARISRVWGTILLTITIFSLGLPVQAKYNGGTGEPNNPYQIAKAEDLMLLGESPEDYDKHFILTADIDLDPNLPGREVFDRAVIAPDTNDVKNGFQGTPFTGVFDGEGYMISHFTIIGGRYLGLFGRLGPGAEVRDLGVIDINITGTEIVGGLAGYNSGSITKSSSAGLVSGISSFVGGLVGRNPGEVTNSYSTSTVNGESSVGGLIGQNYAESVRGPGVCAGFVARCYSTGLVSGYACVGGLVGIGGGDIINCYSKSVVNGDCNVGGLVGTNWGTYFFGAPISFTGLITQCYSTGAVGGNEQVGGLVGSNTCDYGDEGIVSYSFWDVHTSEQATSAGGTGFTTAEMQTASTFLDAGWDFVEETANGIENIWWILEGQDYPKLWWEKESGENEIVINIDTDFEYVPQGWPLGLWPGQTPAVGLSADPYEILAKEPQYGAGQVLYGYIPLGNSNDPNVSFVLDTSSIDNWLLYVDINNNEDLTDDGPPRQNEGTGKFASVMSFHVEVISASGETIVRPYELRLWITAWESPVFYAVCHYTSEISIGAEQYTAIAYESMNHDALYHESGLWIDLNGDGKLDMNSSEEHFQDGAILSIEGKEYVLNLDYP